jgi:hypothetical protein
MVTSPISPAELNERNRRFWDSQSASPLTITTPLQRDVNPATGSTHPADSGSLTAEPRDRADADAYLASHPITVEIKRLGATDELLRSVRFSPASRGAPFAEWAVMGGRLSSPAAAQLCAYCVLKWLLLDDPPPSRDRDDAWAYIALREMHPLIAAGMKAPNLLRAQKDRARKPRVKLDGEMTIGRLIAQLALAAEHRDSSATELWPHLFSRLDDLGACPTEHSHPGNRRKSTYLYESETKRRTISYGHFATVVGQARKNKKSR